MAQKSKITVLVLVLLSAILLFWFLNSPLSQTQQASQFNLLVLGSVGWLVLLEFRKSETILFGIKDAKDLINDTATGAIVGLVTIFIVIVILGAAHAVYNLFGSVATEDVSIFSTELQIFTMFIQPITETIIIIGLFRTIQEISRNNLLAFGLTALAFSVFHFNAFGAANFPYTFDGFVQFVLSPQGAFNQLVLGVIFIATAIGYKSWIAAAVAHIFYNTYAVAVIWTGFLDPIVLLTFAIMIGITTLVFLKNGLKETFEFNIKALVSANVK